MSKVIKKYKFSCCNKWANDEKAINKEVIRAGKFLIAQIKKGWSVEEAWHQVGNSYGYLVQKACFEAFQRVLSKKS